MVTTIAGAAGELGTVDSTGGDARFSSPSGIALDEESGLLYIADTGNHAIRRLDLTTHVVSTLAVTPNAGDSFTSFVAPRGIALSGKTLFVTDSDNATVLAIDLATRTIRTLAGAPGVMGAADGRGPRANFDVPLGIVADTHGHVYVADVLNHTVRKILVSTGDVTTLAGTPRVLGDRDGIGTDAQFRFPSYLAVDSRGDLFVSDIINQNVRQVDIDSGAVTTIIGVTLRPGVMLGAVPAQLGQPSAIALSSTGELIIVSESSLLRAR